MKFLNHNEIKENSFVMIEFTNGTKEPYFVDRKRKGAITKATMLLGHQLSELIRNPKLYPCSLTGGTERFYIANEDTAGHHKGVLGYRKLNKEEKSKGQEQIKTIK